MAEAFCAGCRFTAKGTYDEVLAAMLEHDCPEDGGLSDVPAFS